MNTNHTAGPWVADQGEGEEPDRWTVISTGPRPYLIAIIENGQPGDTLDTEAATARLIASAPELLDALKNASDMLAAYCGEEGHCQSAIEESRAAIAKATGKEKP